MKRKIDFSWTQFEAMPVVGIMRRISYDKFVPVAEMYCDSGFTTLEITIDTADFDLILAYALEAYAGRLNIGAGTVCDEADLERALQAGAQFIVTPNIDKAVVERCRAQGIPCIAGAFSPSEAYLAWKYGASLVKLFPARSLGPSYLSDLKNGPLRQVEFLPTGGVSLENAADYLASGAKGLGIGNPLFDHDLIAWGDWKSLADRFSRFYREMSRILGRG